MCPSPPNVGLKHRRVVDVDAAATFSSESLLFCLHSFRIKVMHCRIQHRTPDSCSGKPSLIMVQQVWYSHLVFCPSKLCVHYKSQSSNKAPKIKLWITNSSPTTLTSLPSTSAWAIALSLLLFIPFLLPNKAFLASSGSPST